ncbi:MAG: DUF4430 domain-containing protein [Clostridia bacterium]|nr:DUF4430 domain-containing protein [Clostridia bacterium]
MKRQNKKSIISVIAIIMLVSITVCFSFAVSSEEKAKVSLRIEGDTECLYSTTEEVAAGSTLKALLEAVNTKASLQMVGLETNYITSIKGLSAAKYGGWDGWLYSVNGVVPTDSISDIKLKSGDEVVLFYGDPYGVGFQYPELEISDGSILVYSMDTEYDAAYNPIVKKKAVASASVSIFDPSGKEYKYVTNENGVIAVDSALLKPGTYTYKIEKYAQNGLPLVLRVKEGASYTVSSSPATSDVSVVVAVISAISLSLGTVYIRRKTTR